MWAGQPVHEPHAEGGVSVAQWVHLYQYCHAITGYGVWCTKLPGEDLLIDESALTIAMFDLIGSELAAEMEARQKDA